MTKPILWLGPLEDLDVDYDPLLGRSARQPGLNAASVATKTVFDPSRSVFDDPAELETVAQQPAQIQAAQPEIAPTPANDPVTYEPTPFVEATSEVAPPHLDLAQPEPTDFTHNNDPIPARHDTIARQAALQVPMQGSAEVIDSDLQPEQASAEQTPVDRVIVATPTANRSFFTSLFSKRSTPVAAAGASAFISNMQAPEPPEPALVPTPEPVTIAETTNSIKAEAPPSSPVQGNIWDDIDKADYNATSEDSTEIAPVVVDAEPLEILESALPDDVSLVTQEADPEASATISDMPVAEIVEEPVGPETMVPEPIDAGPLDQEPIAPSVERLDLDTNLEANVQPLVNDEPFFQTPNETAPDALSEAPRELQREVSSEVEAEPVLADTAIPASTLVADAAPAVAPDFKSAFNADKFWSIPTTQVEVAETSPAQEVGGAYDQDRDSDDLSPHDDGDGVSQTTPPNVSLLDTPVSPAAPIVTAPIPPDVAARARTAARGKRRKRKVKKNYVGAFFGTFLFGVALLMTLVSSLAAFGYPFDMISSYRWYWIILSVIAAGIWGLSRGWKMVAAAFVVMAANLFVTIPATGEAPKGGKDATAVVGWANVAGNPDALARVFRDAEKKKATLLMLAETPQAVFTPPVGWTLIEAPLAGDPTAIAVLSKSTWRAVTVPGEPTMARPPAGDLTVIGVHPQDANKRRRRTPNRDALINRAGTRAGIQEGPTIVLGDFNAAPWDKAMNQFRNYGNVTRVRCGGWAGTTLTQAFGLIGVATDHTFVRDVKVTHCQLGGPLTGGNHKPIWLYVIPQPAAPVSAPQP